MKKAKKMKVHKTDQTEVNTENVNIKAEPKATTSFTYSAQRAPTTTVTSEMLGEFDFSNVQAFVTQSTTTSAQLKLEKVTPVNNQFQSIMAYVL